LTLYDREVILEGTPKKVTDFYQKLVFSDDKKKVLGEITGNTVKQAAVSANNNTLVIEEDKDYYLPNLQSKPTIIKNADVEIFDAMILNEEGKRVNVLKCEDLYKLVFKVQMGDDINSAIFGFTIKNNKGLILGGFVIDKYRKKTAIGSLVEIEALFVNLFANDTYFITIGITNKYLKDGGYFLYRALDYIGFQVLDFPVKHWGLCLLNKDLKC